MTNDKEKECNFVAESHNWNARITREEESARVWTANWGELYGKSETKDNKEKIKSLEKEMQKLPASGTMSNYQLSHTWTTPYEDTTLHRRKNAGASCPQHSDSLLDLDQDGETVRSTGAKRPEP
mmetsp:Transcript_17340/g.34775  ORF Transcript_17340/g.34775 Transcript_17340/m.34775 type:complete len:124 (+) Transcript_17340:2698-3069(+)